jgi:hypothetical protein
LAIVWTDGTAEAARANAVIAVSNAHNLSAEELTGGAQDSALQSFRSGRDWYRGAEVDRLSEDEAGIIADRLMLRATAIGPIVAIKCWTCCLLAMAMNSSG